eukprot:PhF_6_TR1039/c1_g1_i6/m.2131
MPIFSKAKFFVGVAVVLVLLTASYLVYGRYDVVMSPSGYRQQQQQRRQHDEVVSSPQQNEVGGHTVTTSLIGHTLEHTNLSYAQCFQRIPRGKGASTVSSDSSVKEIFHRSLYELSNVCLEQASSILYAHTKTQDVFPTIKLTTEIGVPVDVPVARNSLLFKQMRSTLSFEDTPVWVHPVWRQDAFKFGHTLYRIAATLNAMERLFGSSIIHTHPPHMILQFPYSMWGVQMSTMYTNLTALMAAPTSSCRSVYLSSNRFPPLRYPTDPELWKLRCFKKVYVGWMPFPLLTVRQNTSLLARRARELYGLWGVDTASRYSWIVLVVRSLGKGRGFNNTEEIRTTLERVYPPHLGYRIRVVDLADNLSMSEQATYYFVFIANK